MFFIIYHKKYECILLYKTEEFVFSILVGKLPTFLHV